MTGSTRAAEPTGQRRAATQALGDPSGGSAPAPRALLGEVVRIIPIERLGAWPFRLPDPTHPDETHLYAANHRSVDWASAHLARLFPGLPLGRFGQATDATTMMAAGSHRDLLAALDPERAIEGLFQRFHVEPPAHLRIMRDRTARDLTDVVVHHPGTYPGGRLRVRPAALATALDEGYTLVLDGIELRDVASTRLTELFERTFGCQVNINGYLSTRTHTSFGAHWDDQEVVILQLLGRKDWQVQRPVALSPMKASHGDDTSGETVWEGRLEAGDTLYVPRGWGHIVNGIDELTFHYTITIPRLHGISVLGSVLGELADAQVPSEPGRAVPMLPGTRQRSELPHLDDDAAEELIRSALARHRFGLTARTTQSLRAVHDLLRGGEIAGLSVRCPAPGGWVVAGGTDQDLWVGMAGTVLAVPRAAIPDVAATCDGSLHPASSLDSDLRRGLVHAGLLEVVTDDVMWRLRA